MTNWILCESWIPLEYHKKSRLANRQKPHHPQLHLARVVSPSTVSGGPTLSAAPCQRNTSRRRRRGDSAAQPTRAPPGLPWRGHNENGKIAISWGPHHSHDSLWFMVCNYIITKNYGFINHLLHLITGVNTLQNTTSWGNDCLSIPVGYTGCGSKWDHQIIIP